MENQFFINAGFPPPAPPLHFGSSLSPSPMPDWQSLSSAMEIQSQDCFHGLQYDSALSSMVSSPAASNCNISGESLMIRELIGKLGSIGNSGEISPHSQPLMGSYNSSNTSCYNTPLNSPPKSMGLKLNSSVADFSADPGFAERAAKFSCFGSRSFNGRTSQFVPNDNNNNTEMGGFRSNQSPLNAKLPRVSSSPAIKAMTSQANSQEESTISEQNPKASNSRKRKSVPKAKTKEPSPSPNASKVSEVPREASNEKRCKLSENNGNEKAEEDDTKVPEPPKDYIHVRARRGQATDSHSLAERVRREKISERMKLLQNLVPGCNKVTGKALMLDEIINYVQSLQRQVEFLSMKLSSVNTRLDFNMESLMSKDIFQSNNNLQHPIFPINSSASSSFFGHQPLQNPPLQCSVDPLDTPICPKLNTHLPQINHFTETVPQYQTFCEGDLETLVQMGLHSQNFQGSNQVSDMKMEL